MATIDYMIAAYGPFSASATGGNGFARDFLAGIAAMYATPFFENLPEPYTLETPTTILACIALVATIPIYIFYWKGEWFRNRSQFAQSIGKTRAANNEGRRVSTAQGMGGQHQQVRQRNVANANANVNAGQGQGQEGQSFAANEVEVA